MEKDILREMHGDIKVIKTQVDGLVTMATTLEKRLGPVESDYQFRSKLYKLLLGGGGFLGIIFSIAAWIRKT